MHTDVKSACQLILAAGAVKIRDVDGGEDPFLYSSGNKGPGYVSVKGMVSHYPDLEKLCRKLAIRINDECPRLDFVAANATGGMIPGWITFQELRRFKSGLRYVYVRETRKKGGHREHITGLDEHFRPGAHALVFEELVNFAETVCNSAELLRKAGFTASTAACILSYDHPAQRQRLRDSGVHLIHLVTLDQVLTVAKQEMIFSPKLIASYREFLEEPTAWMTKRNLTPDPQGGTK